MNNFNINAPINGSNVQVGNHNNIYTEKSLSIHENELLKLFNDNCQSEKEKSELIQDLKEINSQTVDVTKPASRILSFIKSTGVDLTSSVIVKILEKYIIA